MARFQLEENIDQLYRRWHDVILECTLKAAVLIRSNNHREKFDLKHNKKVTYFSKTKKIKVDFKRVGSDSSRRRLANLK